MRPRVLLADDHQLLLEAFKKLLEEECEIVGMVTDGRALLEAAPRLKPDVVVLDISMPLLNGLEAGRRLKQMMPGIKLIFLTVNEDPDLVAEAFRGGGSGYLLKSSAGSELFQAIHEVLRGRAYVTPLVTQGMVDAFIQDPNRETKVILTARQKEVLQLLVEGRTMKEVGAILNVSPRTVAFHKYQMMRRLRIKNTAELIQYAIRNGIVSA